MYTNLQKMFLYPHIIPKESIIASSFYRQWLESSEVKYTKPKITLQWLQNKLLPQNTKLLSIFPSNYNIYSLNEF